MAGKLNLNRPNIKELMCASNVLAALRIHDEEAHKIIANAVAERLQEQRNGIANAVVAFTDGMKISEPVRSQLLRLADQIRGALELHWNVEGEADDVRPVLGIAADESAAPSPEPTP